MRAVRTPLIAFQRIVEFFGSHKEMVFKHREVFAGTKKVIEALRGTEFRLI